jgi:integrase
MECHPFEDEDLRELEKTFRRGTWEDLRDRALIALGAICPSRVSEMLALSGSDVADAGGRVAGSWHCAARNNKTRTATDYEITPVARAALEAWLPVRARTGYRPCDPLFPARGRARAMSRWAAWAMVKRRVARSDINEKRKPFLRTHSLKHTAISNAYDGFMARRAAGDETVDPIRDTQAFSGHRTLPALLHYLRPRSEAARREGYAAADARAMALMPGKGGE